MTRVSVITVCLNAAATIERTLRSIRSQKDVAIEHIVIDGGSTDGTLAILERHRDTIAHLVSEPDTGLYDAMNKGLALATGEFVGFLNADDAFAAPDVIEGLMRVATRTGSDAVYGDVLQVDAYDRASRLIKGAAMPARGLRRGLMPPHPAFYARTHILRAAGGFDTSYRRAADFDLMARLFRDPGFRAAHRPGVVTLMRLGGLSTQGVKGTYAASLEILRSCRANGIDVTRWSVLSRYPLKAREVINGRLMRLGGWVAPQ
ncbi:PGL/p-HBAD biosynthesis glycosyltransferase [Alphaproteobacteria bacterium SO-S41]|nr:PGL/p-HBAD biosynthesis glycosyltransferase [Alphaproteobacteria bacterium SO-S41]